MMQAFKHPNVLFPNRCLFSCSQDLDTLRHSLSVFPQESTRADVSFEKVW